MPRRTAIGLLPAAMLRSAFLEDRLGQDRGGGRAVAGDVQVFEATSLTSLAPMFSKRSSSSISLLTVTPSLVTVGPPNDLSMITLRPVGPSVTATASASFSTPAQHSARACIIEQQLFCHDCGSSLNVGVDAGDSGKRRRSPATRSDPEIQRFAVNFDAPWPGCRSRGGS